MTAVAAVPLYPLGSMFFVGCINSPSRGFQGCGHSLNAENNFEEVIRIIFGNNEV